MKKKKSVWKNYEVTLRSCERYEVTVKARNEVEAMIIATNNAEDFYEAEEACEVLP